MVAEFLRFVDAGCAGAGGYCGAGYLQVYAPAYVFGVGLAAVAPPGVGCISFFGVELAENVYPATGVELIEPGAFFGQEAGILLDLIKKYAPTKSILGVCLGQQAIAEAFGGSLINLSEIFHGVATEATQMRDHKLFKNLPEKLEVGRYHSWAVNPEDFPDELEITSVDESGMIMSLKHKTYDVHAVQYHPESILTPHGKQILENFLTS